MKYILYNSYSVVDDDGDIYIDYFIGYNKNNLPMFLFESIDGVIINDLEVSGITIDEHFLNFLKKNDIIFEDGQILNYALFAPSKKVEHKPFLKNKLKNIMNR